MDRVGLITRQAASTAALDGSIAGIATSLDALKTALDVRLTAASVAHTSNPGGDQPVTPERSFEPSYTQLYTDEARAARLAAIQARLARVSSKLASLP